MATTATGGPRLLDDPCEEDLKVLADCMPRLWGGSLVSLVAVGSAGRVYAERLPRGTAKPEDYDLIAVVNTSSPAFQSLQRGPLKRWSARAARRLGVPVSIGVLRKSELPTLPFTLFNYELRYGSRVLLGSDLSEQMPGYQGDRLPLIEATRLLLNRGVPLWGDCLRVNSPDMPGLEQNAIALRNRKAIMGIGDALLMAGGRFHWTYQGRIERAEGCPLFDTVAFRGLRARYVDAIQAKMLGALPDLNLETLRVETLGIFALHEQVLRFVEEQRLDLRLDDWRNYTVTATRYPEYLRGSPLKRLFRFGLSLGLSPRTGLYRSHAGRSVEEILLTAFPHVAYGKAHARSWHRRLGLGSKSESNQSTTWERFHRLWSTGR